MKLLCKILFLLVLTALPAISPAKEWKVGDVPVPYLQDHRLHVSDPEQRLSPQARQEADCYLDSLERVCGVQSVVIVVGSVPGADCFRFAQDFGNRYGVGTKKDRNGLVVVIAVDDRRYFIAPGKGLEAHLTDIECNDIAQQCIVSNMKVGNIDSAVTKLSKAVYWNIKGDNAHYDSIVYSVDNGSDTVLALFMSLLCFGLPLWLFFRNRKRGNGRNHHDNISDNFPPFFFGGGGGSWGGGSSPGSFGGSFGGGSFGGGGSGGGW